MSFRVQPCELAYAPPSYPSHCYQGEGTIYTIRVGYEPDDIAGYLTLQGETVCFNGNRPPWTSAGIVRCYVNDTLRDGALRAVPLADTIATILATVWHDDPVVAPLAGLAGS